MMINIQRILVPTDFSEPGKHALKYAIAFAQQFGAVVDVLHVMEPIPPGMMMTYIAMEEIRDHSRGEVKTALKELEPLWEEAGLEVDEVIVEGYPFVEIVKHARESNADLIVMGTHGHGAIKHALLGSVAERTVRKAPCPVLTVRHSDHEFVHP